MDQGDTPRKRKQLDHPEEGADTRGGKRAKKEKKLGGRARHPDSDGESDNEDPSILYRSLREEENPFASGLQPPADHDPSITASAHITSGSKARVKSPYVSATRSRKVAAAWAAKTNERYVKFTKPSGEGVESYDMTDDVEARQVFPAGKGTSFNTARASQEVVIKGGIPKENMLAVYSAKKVTVGQYNAAPPTQDRIRSRTKTKERPIPVFIDVLREASPPPVSPPPIFPPLTTTSTEPSSPRSQSPTRFSPLTTAPPQASSPPVFPPLATTSTEPSSSLSQSATHFAPLGTGALRASPPPGGFPTLSASRGGKGGTKL